MQKGQKTLFENNDNWKITLNVKHIERREDPARLEYVPCAVTAEINELGRLQFSCTCEKGKKQEICDHVLRAIGGDVYLLRDQEDENQRKDIFDVYQKCLSTDIYEAICDYYDKSKSTKDTNLKSDITKQHLSLSHLVMSSGIVLGSGEKIKNYLRVLKSLLNKNNKRSLPLPLFLPERSEESGWYYEPRPCMATPLGLNAQERTKQAKRDNAQKPIIYRYLARFQSSNFAFSVGDVFFTSDRHYVQVLNVQERIPGDAATQIIEFKISKESSSHTPSFSSLPVRNFIYLLITGNKNERQHF